MSDGSLRPPMKLLFVILAHDRPEDAAELARTLVAAASDARALIHFDARAAPGRLRRARGGGRRTSRGSASSRSASPAAGAASAWSRRR